VVVAVAEGDHHDHVHDHDRPLGYNPCYMPGRVPANPETVTQEGTSSTRPSEKRAILFVVGCAAEGGGIVGSERTIPFGHTIEIGRRPQAQPGMAACCLRDPRVSARHARVSRLRNGAFEVADLDSKNGTSVEGHLISGPTKIGDGTLLFIGGHALVVRDLAEDALFAIREDLDQPFGPVATLSASMATEIRRLRRLARAGKAILLSGETGVGKEVYARAVHGASGRPGRFVALNCAAIPTDLVESELFGFVRGAHSQAAASKPGLIEGAEHGTLFLDEIGDMPGPAQAKLLRFLQEHAYVPLGGREARRMDVRVIGATSSLAPSAQAHGLRRDLLARFGAEPVVLPPLRERREDVGALVRHFLGQHCSQAAAPFRPLETGAFLALCLHDWPQNVRELENVIREAILYGEGKPEIRLEDLPRAVRERVKVDDDKQSTRRRSPRARPDKAEIEALLDRHKGNVAEVARELDRQWAVVWRWILKSGLDVEKYRK
jgi:DNA-binding NtrC family response regulator